MAGETTRVLVLAPVGRDSDAICRLLRENGMACEARDTLSDLAASIDDAAGAVIVTEEALARQDAAALVVALDAQPTWSDLPFVFLSARRAGPPTRADAIRGALPARVTNVVVLERPLSSVSLLSAVTWAMTARNRQFQIRDQLLELEQRTEQLRASEAALKASTAELRLVADALPVLIAFVDHTLVYRFANQAYVEWFYRSPEEVIGRPVHEIVGEPAFSDRLPAMHKALEGQASTLELSWPHLDGRRRDADIRYLPRFGPAGEVEGFYVFVMDITERKQAEEVLRAAAEILEREVAERTAERDQIWRHSTELMAVAGADGQLKAVNPAWTQVLGYGEAELLSRPFAELLHPEDRAAAAEVASRLVSGSAVASYENRLRRADGGYSLISWTAASEEGLVFAIGRDISDQRRMEELLRQSQKMEAVGQLTGGIAHDFNNLLTGIMGSLDLMRRRIAIGRYDQIERFMEAASGSASRAAALTHRLLAFSRRQSLDPRAIDVNELVASMGSLLSSTVGENIRLETRLAPGLALARADANQLESALLNLVINSRDAMPGGGRLTIETSETIIQAAETAEPGPLQPGAYVVLCVTDTGMGMTQDVLAKVFDPFYTTKPIGQGTGLGLSMIYGFAQQSGGHVGIDSRPGEGASVKLYLPVAGPADARPDSAVALTPPQGDGETVLVVEDDPSVRMLVLEVLGELGYAALEASDAKSALPILRSQTRIDLMVSDVGLPGVDGRQLAELARVHRPGLKVLFVTGYAQHAEERSSFLGVGMDMVAKPFALDVLATKIRDMVAA